MKCYFCNNECYDYSAQGVNVCSSCGAKFYSYMSILMSIEFEYCGYNCTYSFTAKQVLCREYKGNTISYYCPPKFLKLNVENDEDPAIVCKKIKEKLENMRLLS
jgi:hypothetical protein